MKFKFAALVLAVGALLALAACGGGVPATAPISSTPAATAVSTPTVPAPAMIAPTAMAEPIVTPQPTPSAVPTAPAPTVTQIPADTPTPEPKIALPTAFREYGFDLIVERGADIQTLGAASPEQGAITFAYGKVNAVVTWLPQVSGALALISGTYNLIQSSQPNLSFDTLADGELEVDGELGFFLGFKAEDAAGSTSGGLIGSWDCRSSGTAFTLTLTGTDTALVQVRFDELLDNFACAVS